MVGRSKSRPKEGAAVKTEKIVVRRNSNKIYGVFIDGIGLDRASRRLQRKVDLTALLKGLTSGAEAKIARYYTLLPQEDDSRHRAFLDAVAKAGFEVLSKRLPPKGIERQVAVDVEMSADMVSFALGRDDLSSGSSSFASGQFSISSPSIIAPNNNSSPSRSSVVSPHPANVMEEESKEAPVVSEEQATDSNRVIVVVCPSRELSYTLSLCKHFGADTVTADFGKFIGGDVLKSAAKWIDLSDSQTIWK